MENQLLSILITGASTGIGREVALKLAQEGHQVFASVRRKKDAAELTSAKVTPLIFDVTEADAMQAAVLQIRELVHNDRPFSIINNAGVAVAGPLEDLPIEEFRNQFEVNVFGALRVIQLFLPLVRESRGRIVNMSSVSGKVVSPFLGAYAASKFALEAMSDALRRELAAEGIKVLLIEPGPIKTPIWEKGFKMKRKTSPQYDEALERFTRHVRRAADNALSPDRVVAAVLRALTDFDPPARQIVSSLTSRVEFEISRALPSSWLDRAVVWNLFGKRREI